MPVLKWKKNEVFGGSLALLILYSTFWGVIKSQLNKAVIMFTP